MTPTYIPLRLLSWCNTHDIPWASHTDVGISWEGCERGERWIVDMEKVKKYGDDYRPMLGDWYGTRVR